jgi:hypothetical protein
MASVGAASKIMTNTPAAPPPPLGQQCSILHHFGTMAGQQNDLTRLPRGEVKFRILVIGRANSGMTSILERVCDTTESPEIHSPSPKRGRPTRPILGRRETAPAPTAVRFLVLVATLQFNLKSSQVQLEPSMEVRQAYTCRCSLIVMTRFMQRPQRNIEDELIFPSHNGYIYHLGPGLESGSDHELNIVRDFVSRRSRERRLKDRVHAIWFVPFGCLQSQVDGVFFPGTAFRWTMTDPR